MKVFYEISDYPQSFLFYKIFCQIKLIFHFFWNHVRVSYYRGMNVRRRLGTHFGSFCTECYPSEKIKMTQRTFHNSPIFRAHFWDEKKLPRPPTYIYVVGPPGVSHKTRIYTWLVLKELKWKNMARNFKNSENVCPESHFSGKI